MEPQHTVYRLIYTHQRWPEIKQTLTDIQSGNLSPKDIFKHIEQFHQWTCGSNIKVGCLADALVSHSSSLPQLLGLVAEYILRSEGKHESIEIVVANVPRIYTYRKQSFLLIMCLMLFNLTLRQTHNKIEGFPLNFGCFMDDQPIKMQSVIGFIDIALGTQRDSTLKLSIKRVSGKKLFPGDLQNCHIKLNQIHMESDQTDIQSFFGDVKIDFANKYIGGGSLGYGMVQQEIMFICHPQLYVTMLICQKMEDEEAIGLLGFKKYWKVKGYREGAMLAGPETHVCKIESECYQEYIVAIDAIHAPSKQFRNQFILREINKAAAGFSCYQGRKIVTGNWGCGAFGGNLHMKLIIQWIVSTLLNLHMVYCPFGRGQELQPTIQIVGQMTVSEAFKLITEYEKRWRKEYEKSSDKKCYPFQRHILEHLKNMTRR